MKWYVCYRYNPIIQPENEEKAHRAFLALYEAVYQQIVQRTVQATICPPVTPQQILSVINNACKDGVFASTDADGLFTIVGPFQNVSVAENFILRQNAKHSHARGERKLRQSEEGEEAEGGSRGATAVFDVGGRLTVKVYSADITHLPGVDVIVNAANERLQNYAGVAGAIERAGGDQLRQDCEAIVEQGGPLKVLQASTSLSHSSLSLTLSFLPGKKKRCVARRSVV